MYYYYKSVEVVLKNAILYLYLYLYTCNEEKNQIFTKNICYTVDKEQKKYSIIYVISKIVIVKTRET